MNPPFDEGIPTGESLRRPADDFSRVFNESEGFTKPQLSVMSMVNRRETCQVLLIYSFDYT